MTEKQARTHFNVKSAVMLRLLFRLLLDFYNYIQLCCDPEWNKPIQENHLKNKKKGHSAVCSVINRNTFCDGNKTVNLPCHFINA